MSDTYPPPPPPDPNQPYGRPPQPYGEQPAVPVPPPPPPAYGQQPPVGGYGAMPGAPMGGVPVGPAPTRPAAMENAVKLMKLGGILSLLSLVAVFFSTGAIREAATKAAEDAGTSVDKSTIDAVVALGVGFSVVSGLIGVALWFWMAAMNGRGKSWARVVATVFFVLSLLTTLFSLIQPGAALSKLLSLVMLLIGAAAIFFMYKKESSDWYAAMSRPRY